MKYGVVHGSYLPTDGFLVKDADLRTVQDVRGIIVSGVVQYLMQIYAYIIIYPYVIWCDSERLYTYSIVSMELGHLIGLKNP